MGNMVFFRNKKVWENKAVTHITAMDWSTKFFMDWKAAKVSRVEMQTTSVPSRGPNLNVGVLLLQGVLS